MIVIVSRLVNDWGSTLQENWFMYSGVILYSYLCSLPDKRSVMLYTDKALWGSKKGGGRGGLLMELTSGEKALSSPC